MVLISEFRISFSLYKVFSYVLFPISPICGHTPVFFFAQERWGECWTLAMASHHQRTSLELFHILLRATHSTLKPWEAFKLENSFHQKEGRRGSGSRPIHRSNYTFIARIKPALCICLLTRFPASVHSFSICYRSSRATTFLELSTCGFLFLAMRATRIISVITVTTSWQRTVLHS